MGKTASDWSKLKAIIEQKDNAIDSLTQQLTASQKALDAANQQIKTLQAQFDSADLSALAEMSEVVADNPIDPPAAPAAKAAAPAASNPAPAAPAAKPAASAAPAVTTFTK